MKSTTIDLDTGTTGPDSEPFATTDANSRIGCTPAKKLAAAILNSNVRRPQSVTLPTTELNSGVRWTDAKPLSNAGADNRI